MRRILGFILLACAVAALSNGAMAQRTSVSAEAVPLVTDQSKLTLSNRFSMPGEFRLTEGGGVYFNATSSAEFYWSNGVRSRLLQGGDEQPGYPGSVLDLVGYAFEVNAVGHAAMLNYFSHKDMQNPRGIFVYDGTNYTPVATKPQEAPGTGGKVFSGFGALRINNLDQVAFIANFDQYYLGNSGIFVGSPGGTPSKIVLTGEVYSGAALRNISLQGFNDAGQVLFAADMASSFTRRGLFLRTGEVITQVFAGGDQLPTESALNWRNLGNAFLTAAGQVAFDAQTFDGNSPVGRRIWVFDSKEASYSVLADSTLSTGTSVGGTFGGNFVLRGFNHDGLALFSADPWVNGAQTHALFLKEVGKTATVVFARGELVSDGSTEKFNTTNQASLNEDGDVAFLASLQGGSSPYGWFFLDNGNAVPVAIALEGNATPVGGTYGLAMELAACRMNTNGQVAFWAEILGPNDSGLFLWTPGSGTQAVVTTMDRLPAKANTIIRTFMPAASDDRVIFQAWKAGGRITAFARPLPPAKEQFIRLVGEGDAAPDIGGRIWSLSGYTPVNNEEEVVFSCVVIGANRYPATLIFTYHPSFGLRKIAATGDAAPGKAGGDFVNVSYSTAVRPQGINSSGQVAFFGNTDAPSAEPGIFISSANGTPLAIARRGDAAPNSRTFWSFSSVVAVTDDGRVAFRAVTRADPTNSNTERPGIFVGTGSGVPLKVMELGDQLAGIGTMNSVPAIFDMNNTGTLAYVANLRDGSADKGVFRGAAGGTQHAIALSGGEAADTGGLFDDFREPDININDAGTVTFWAGISGSTQTTTGQFLATETSPPVARLVEGQHLPGGGKAGMILPALNNFIGDQSSLAESGEMSLFVFNVTGGSNLPKKIIMNTNGEPRGFLSVGEKAPGLSGYIALVFQSSGTNPKGDFFSTVLISEGLAKVAIYWNGGKKE